MAEIKVPQAGESITEVSIAELRKKTGDVIKKDEVLLVLETDKASMDIVSEFSGKVSLKVKEGDVVKIGAILAEIDTTVAADVAASPPPPAPTAAPPSAPRPGNGQYPVGASASPDLSPAVRKIVAEKKLEPSSIQGTGKGGRLTKMDVVSASNLSTVSPSASLPVEKPEVELGGGEEKIWREPMTNVRKAIARNLVQSQHTNAILSTFNEIDMFEVQKLRQIYKDKFKDKYGISLGLMGFFIKATCLALEEFPKINAVIDGEDIVYKNFVNMGIAVAGKKGLLVPVIRHADKMSLADLEKSVRYFAEAGQAGRVSIDEMSGGTFAITNGGTFGSLMSTPIINPGQSGILGLHKIEDRPVARDGQVVIRPMMYVTLSYDHRLIDGAESVRFLVRVKECMEDPARLLIGI